jgi:ABC transporter substrate binding protein
MLVPSFEDAARLFGVTPILTPVHSAAEIEAAITSLGREPGSGFLGMPDNFIEIHRASIISLAAQNKLTAVYQTAFNARDCGLLAYGANFRDIFRRAASYVDRILRGEKPSELPVQMPTKFVLVIRDSLRPNSTPYFDRAGRRGDRLRAAMSALGPKRTSLTAPHMSAFRGFSGQRIGGMWGLCLWRNDFLKIWVTLDAQKIPLG